MLHCIKTVGDTGDRRWVYLVVIQKRHKWAIATGDCFRSKISKYKLLIRKIQCLLNNFKSKRAANLLKKKLKYVVF